MNESYISISRTEFLKHIELAFWRGGNSKAVTTSVSQFTRYMEELFQQEKDWFDAQASRRLLEEK